MDVSNVHIKRVEDSHSSVAIIRRQEREMLCHAAVIAQACDSIQLEQHCLSVSMCLSSAVCLVMFWLLVRSRRRREKRYVEAVALACMPRGWRM
jgi:hypothetical protein